MTIGWLRTSFLLSCLCSCPFQPVAEFVKLVLASVLVAQHLYLKQKISSSHSFIKHLLSSCYVPGSLPGSGYDTESKAQLLTTKSSWSTSALF